MEASSGSSPAAAPVEDETMRYYRTQTEEKYLPADPELEFTSQIRFVVGGIKHQLIPGRDPGQGKLEIDMEVFLRVCTEICAWDAETVRDALQFDDSIVSVFSAIAERAEKNKRLEFFLGELRTAAGLGNPVDESRKSADLARGIMGDACACVARIAKGLDRDDRAALGADLMALLVSAFDE